MTHPASPQEGRFRGQAAVTLTSGELSATFLPELGLTGVSLRYRGREHLALRGGLAALRRGSTTGLPLLAPWANRLGALRYRAAGVTVDLAGLPLHTDSNGLPMHGLLVGQPGWRVERQSTRGGRARFRASIDVDARAFPFPHRIEVSVAADADRLIVDTTIIPTGRRRVPIAFGWHPYLRLPGTHRPQWRLRLPTRAHLALDDRGIPTGAETTEQAEAEEIGRRTFDDLYRLGRDRELAFEAEDGSSLTVRPGAGYSCAQVWVPKGRPYAALEPMAAPTNSLVDGSGPLVEPGDRYRAELTITITGPRG